MPFAEGNSEIKNGCIDEQDKSCEMFIPLRGAADEGQGRKTDKQKQKRRDRSRRRDGPPSAPNRKDSIAGDDVDEDPNDAMIRPQDVLEYGSSQEGKGSTNSSTLSEVEGTSTTTTTMSSSLDNVSSRSSDRITTSRFSMDNSIYQIMSDNVRKQLSHEEWIQMLTSEISDHDDDHYRSTSSFSELTDDASNFTAYGTEDAVPKKALAFEFADGDCNLSFISDFTEVGERDTARANERNNKTSKISKTSTVAFGKVQVRIYERILEVHPCTSSGPSIGIGWNYVEDEPPQDIDWCKNPKTCKEFRLTRSDRESIIRDELGYSSRDVARAIRATLKMKHQRRTTVNNLPENNILPVEKVEYLMERCNRRLRKLYQQVPTANAA